MGVLNHIAVYQYVKSQLSIVGIYPKFDDSFVSVDAAPPPPPPQPPADLAALAEAAASDHAPRNAMTAYFRAVAAHHRAEATERERIAALDAEVVWAIRSHLNAKSNASHADALRAIVRRFGGTP